MCIRDSLKSLWTTGVDREVDADDRRITIKDADLSAVKDDGITSSASAAIDLLDIAKVRARYRTEVQREWFGQRYNDVLDDTWGASVNIDADERPQLVMRSSRWLSGYDVDGTGDENLGQYSGKAASMVELRIPRKFFPEHGALWIMALVRFPSIHEGEQHYLYRQSQPTYKEIAGDPDIMGAEPPHELFSNQILEGGTTSLGVFPYGQWYRTHPSVTHTLYEDLDGFPFLKVTPSTKNGARYVSSDDYDRVFQTTQLGHWRSQARINLLAHRLIPSAQSSIFAGA